MYLLFVITMEKIKVKKPKNNLKRTLSLQNFLGRENVEVIAQLKYEPLL